MKALSATAVLAAAVVFVSDARAADPGELITVEAEGIANVVEGNLLNTRKFSLDAAQRQAVEEALGVLISGQRVISQARLIEEQVFAQTAGYLKEWEVLEEREEDGVYITKIRAVVKLGDVRDDLDALGMLIQTQKVGNPRVMMLIDEKIDGKPSEDRTVETGVAEKLLERGYKVVDADQLAEIQAQEAVLKALRGDEGEAAALARRFGAEIALLGKVSAARNDAPGAFGGMASYRGRANLRAVKSSSGDVILAVSKEGAGMDVTDDGAAIRCLASVAAEAGEKLAADLAPALWKSAEVQLAVSGVKDFGVLKQVVKTVRAADGVQNVVTRSFVTEEGEAVFTVQLFGGNAQTLAANLDGRGQTSLDIQEVAAYRIAASVGAAGGTR